MHNRLRKELHFLRAYVILNTAILCLLWFTGFRNPGQKNKFEEIDVERMNIVDADGKWRFVLTNGSRAPGAMIDGKEVKRENSNNTPAIIFYNDEGDESGALFSVGKKKQDGNYYASSRLVFDRFKQDETMALQYYEDNGGGYAGLAVWDRPNTPISEGVEQMKALRKMPEGAEKTAAFKKLEASGFFGADRVFVGKNRSKSSVVKLSDPKGKTRLQLIVDTLGTPRLDFLDENGRVTYSLPDSAHNGMQH